ncbi:MAG: pseudouridine synthase [Alphaproteobacteria bacterium]|nr:pseudouridine synthase [Alphaproteobacteria bacterium]
MPEQNKVQTRIVAADDAEMRLDRWFKRHFPTLGHGRLEKLLRTGQVRINGKRAQAGDRIAAGDTIRIPPLPGLDTPPPPRTKPALDEKEARALQKLVLYRDADMLAIDKPAGLAVQGGSKTLKHLDGMLAALQFDAPEPPRLVHRLDRDTSGVLLLARTRQAAKHLTALFRSRDMRKIYWAVVVGRPQPEEGDIRLALAKRLGRPGEGEERMVVDEKDGEPARTLYRLLDSAGNKVSLLELEPLTGRTHQLRVHCQAIDTPILGDGKYGGKAAFVATEKAITQLHLVARELRIPKRGGGSITVRAKTPPHMLETMKFFGLGGD